MGKNLLPTDLCSGGFMPSRNSTSKSNEVLSKTVKYNRIMSFLWHWLWLLQELLVSSGYYYTESISFQCWLSEFKVTRWVMFGTVLQKHFYFKFRLRDLRDSTYLWLLNSRRLQVKNKILKVCSSNSPAQLFLPNTRALQQLRTIWSSQSLGHPNAPAIPSCSVELRLPVLEICQNCTNRSLFFSLHNMLLTSF